MRSHAKAPSAGSISTGSLAIAGAFLVTLLLSLAFTGTANAAKVHLFKEPFGGLGAPTFSKPLSVAVDQSNGDVLVLEGGANEVQTLKIAAAAGQFRLTYGGRTTTATATGDTSTVTTPKVIKNLSGVVGTFTRGEAISGTGIPANATISKIISATEIEISANATATGSGVSLTAGGLPFSISNSGLKSALEDLLAPSFTPSITVSGGPGSAAGGTYTITFNSRDANELVVSDGTTPLSGGTPTEKVVMTPTQGVNAAIKRFKPDGSVDNFSGLGSNFIDGQRGPGGKTKAECESAPEAASCDETPQNGILIPISAFNVQIAVDNSGGVTNGNIYLTQREAKAIDVFSSAGKYLGQITAAGATGFGGEPSGVAVGANGHIYVGQSGAAANKVLFEFAPSSGTPVNADWVRTLTLANVGIPGNVAAGGGSGAHSTLGAAFVAKNLTNPVVKVNSSFVEAPSPATSFGSGTLVAVNPGAGGGTVFVSGGSVATEYDASSEIGAAVQESTLTAASAIQGLSVRGSTGNVYLSRSGSTTIDVFGPVVSTPTVSSFSATEISTTKATLNGSVNAEGDAVSVCKFEYLTQAAYAANGNSYSGANVPQTKSCAEAIPVDAASHPVSAALSALQANTTYHFRLFAENGAGSATTADKTFSTSPTVVTGDASGVGDTNATLNGTVNPVGLPLSACKFEYLTATEYAENSNAYSGLHAPASKACTPASASIEADFQPHAVSANLTGLQKNTVYHFRLSATNANGTFTGVDHSFETLGPPQVLNEAASEVEIDSAKLSADIDPSGFATTYRFEWGTDASYGHRIPLDADLFVGSGTTPIKVSAVLTALAPSTTYHFRVVATNSSGTTAGPDRQVITLNAAGVPDLPDNRGFELVSPAEKPPGTAARRQLLETIQASEDGQSFLYPLLGGLEDADSGGDVSYLAKRSSTAWLSTKVSPPSIVPSPLPGLVGFAQPGYVKWYSPDLSCGVLYTFNPLTEDTPAADVEQGIFNLYVRHDDGSHTLITDSVPFNPAIAPITGLGNHIITVAGASEDCGKVYFATLYNYFPQSSGLYEWDHGTLRDAGELPDGALAVGGAAVESGSGAVAPGASRFLGGSLQNSVSRDGSRFFFSAPSNEPATVGKRAIFVREEGGDMVIEASRKQGGANDSLGSQYQLASPDGSHVFFTSTYGLTPSSSSGPLENCSNPAIGSLTACDLYDYDTETGQLTNLSATTNPANSKGSVVQGVIGVSDVGSSVYFAAAGQLVPGKGNTYAQNVAGSGAANVYLARDGALAYVATVSKVDLADSGVGSLVRNSFGPSSEVTPEGEHLLFESHGNITGYDSGGVSEAYLYSAEEGTVQCVSCRPDSMQSVGNPTGGSGGQITHPLISSFTASGYRNYMMSPDGERVFFTMPDVLAPGAVSGNQNIYEWQRGQTYLLLSGEPVLTIFGGFTTRLLTASPSGDDVFVRSPEHLTPYDKDIALDNYDIRVDGGFAPPPPPPIPCNPAADECQGTPTPQPGVPSPSSGSFSGPANPAPPALKKAHAKKKKKAKKQRKHRQRSAKRSHSRAANDNRGGAK